MKDSFGALVNFSPRPFLSRPPGEGQCPGLPPSSKLPSGLSRLRWPAAGVEPGVSKSGDHLGPTSRSGKTCLSCLLSVLDLLGYLTHQLFAMAWSPDGTRLATVGKDHMVRIYEPRSSTQPVREGAGPTGSRGARVVWLDDEHIVVSGFNR